MARVTRLVCTKCGKAYAQASYLTCPDCGLDGVLDVEYDYEEIARSLGRRPLASRPEHTMFRYADFLPVGEPPGGLLQVGMTPLYDVPNLAKALGQGRLYLKDDTVNPSGSLKDRASAVALAQAVREGARGAACASTGNAASSLAVLAARLGVPSYIFVPADAPPAKLYQIATCATRVFRVRGTYEDAFDVATRAIAAATWYNRNCGINPYLVEGKKTCSLEIYEQLGYNVPDWIVTSVGDGCILSGQWKAFKELRICRQTDRVPRMLAVQADGARPIVDAFQSGGDVVPTSASTIADSIRVGSPRNWRKALRALRESGGSAVSVSDEEIVSAIVLLGKKAGIFAEPAAAAALAGLAKAREKRIVARGETVVVLVTGSGLKDPQSVRDRVEVRDVDPSRDAIDSLVDG